MIEEKFDLFMTLMKLKSYLLSLLDSPVAGASSFSYTEEFLERKYPAKKEVIISLLVEYDIKSDSDIAFNSDIHIKFKEIVSGQTKKIDIKELLSSLDISSGELLKHNESIQDLKLLKEQKIRDIIKVLFKLGKSWGAHNILDNYLNDFSVLEDSDMIRPEEENHLDSLNQESLYSFAKISEFTKIYLELFSDYYFNYGGDIHLNDFLESLSDMKKLVSVKYEELFQKYGLNPDDLKK